MKKAVMQFTACCLALGISISSFGAVALADNSMTLAGLSEKSTVTAAASMTLAGLTETGTAASGGDGSTAAVTAEKAADETESTDSEAADTESEEVSSAAIAEIDTTATLAGAAATASAETTETSTEAQTETETETELVYDTSMSGELAFAQCENYINVRSDASTDSEVVGKIYNNNSVTILGQLGDWYEIQSGNVTGYVKADYFATGETADEIAETVAYNVATVNAEGLWVHTEASEDSETIGMVYSSDQMEVVSYEGDWMKVVLEDGTYGYVNAWYVDYDSYYSTGETLEEESERLDEEWLEYLAESEAEQARLDEQWLAYLAEQEAAAEAAAAETEASTAAETYGETTVSADTSASSSATLSEAEAAVDEAYQTYLEAQEAADAATQQADEQLVYDTYDEAVDAYQDYLDAVAVADELKYSSDTTDTATTTTTETATATTETTQTEAAQTEAPQTEAAQTEAAQTEAVQTEAAQTEAAQTEAAETEATTTSTSSSSTLGQSIANYAVQFVGNPYVYGGTSLTNGADCSGFTQSVFANFGISIPRTAASQASSGTSVSLSDIQAGDLLFYSDGSGISHVALYIGGGQVVHASTSSTGIIISSYNYRTPVCARRYWS